MKVAVIPARGQSQRIHRKNVRTFHGKPIISYSIETAKESSLFDGGIYVSTEDAEIAMIAAEYGAKWIRRPPELAEVNGAPDPGTLEVTRHAIIALQHAGTIADCVCCIYPCAPLMKASDLELAHRILLRNPKAKHVIAVGGEPLRDAGQFYFSWARAVEDRLPIDIYANHVWKVAVPDSRFCDVNVEADWKRAEELYLALRQPA